MLIITLLHGKSYSTITIYCQQISQQITSCIVRVYVMMCEIDLVKLNIIRLH